MAQRRDPHEDDQPEERGLEERRLVDGAQGCISDLCNVMPEVLARIVSCVNAGDTEGAAAAQATFAAFRTDLYMLGYPPALVKRALYLRDPSVGASRQPALMADPAQDRAIEALLQKYKLKGRSAGGVQRA